jgi:hypothetical protein
VGQAERLGLKVIHRVTSSLIIVLTVPDVKPYKPPYAFRRLLLK